MRACPRAALAAVPSGSTTPITDSADFRNRALGSNTYGPNSTQDNFFYNIQGIGWNTTSGTSPTFLRATNVSGSHSNGGGYFVLNTQPVWNGFTAQVMRYQERSIRNGEEQWIGVRSDAAGRVAIVLTHDHTKGNIVLSAPLARATFSST